MASSDRHDFLTSALSPANSISKHINLLRGWPSPSLLPAAALAEISHRVLSDPATATPALLYGLDPGYAPMCSELAKWLDRFYGPWQQRLGVGPEARLDSQRITITSGASQSIASILESFTDSGYTQGVFMVAPCYFMACPIFADAGLTGRMRAVPEDAEGIDLDYLERSIRELEATLLSKVNLRGPEKPHMLKDPGPFRKIYRHIIYAVPTFSNPSGTTMSLERRKGLVALARKYDALILTDDVYDMLQWHVSPEPGADATNLTTALLPRIVDIDAVHGSSPHDPHGRHFGHAVSNGSFSKLVGPGVRTGWTESTADFAKGLWQTGSQRSGGAASQLVAVYLCEMLKSGDLDRHVDGPGGLRDAYGRRWRLMMNAIRRVLVPLGGQLRRGTLGTWSDGDDVVAKRGEDAEIAGGYFVWLTFPSGPSATEIAARARKDENLTIAFGNLFQVEGDEAAAQFPRDIRLCFAWEDEENIVEGVERLGRVILRMRTETKA